MELFKFASVLLGDISSGFDNSVNTTFLRISYWYNPETFINSRRGVIEFMEFSVSKTFWGSRDWVLFPILFPSCWYFSPQSAHFPHRKFKTLYIPEIFCDRMLIWIFRKEAIFAFKKFKDIKIFYLFSPFFFLCPNIFGKIAGNLW